MNEEEKVRHGACAPEAQGRLVRMRGGVFTLAAGPAGALASPASAPAAHPESISPPRTGRPCSRRSCTRPEARDPLLHFFGSWDCDPSTCSRSVPRSQRDDTTRTARGISARRGPCACPCCHLLTLESRSNWEICEECGWEDDGQDDLNADEVWGGPNGSLSLTDARNEYADHIASLGTENHASAAVGGEGLWRTAAQQLMRDEGHTPGGTR
ncbi:CPCC family cysteine-rich protein [Streptomyces brasiliensis]|nr:CPCC family cysteine-rich protein [Streptomyces brasiliensis]